MNSQRRRPKEKESQTQASKSQMEKFREAAREAENQLTAEEFEKKLQRIAKAQVEKKK